MALEVTVPVMLVVSVTCESGQGVDPVMVRFSPESVPMKLKDMGTIELMIVPVSTVPVCEMAIFPNKASSMVVEPLVPKPSPDCSTVAVPVEPACP